MSAAVPIYLAQQSRHCNAWANGGTVDWFSCTNNCGFVNCDATPWHPTCPMCPITLDLQGNGLKLSGVNPAIYFDLDGDGHLDHSSWTRQQTKDAFLVLDRNGNGTIDDGREMFGNATPLLLAPEIAVHGYEALAEFDDPRLGGDADGTISIGDRIFEHLRLWLDKNRDAFTQDGELITLADAGVAFISLTVAYDGDVDQWGNEYRWTSEIAFASGETSTAVDIFFKRQGSDD